jgi:hypothetical protein
MRTARRFTCRQFSMRGDSHPHALYALRATAFGLAARRCVLNAAQPLLGIVLLCAVPATAQTRSARVEVYAGPSFAAGSPAGSRIATQTENVTGGRSFTFFRTHSRFETATGIDLRVGMRVMRWLSVEGGFGYAAPTLRTTIDQDSENAQVPQIRERLTQYVFDGSAVVLLTQAAFARGRGVPFVIAGAGHVRQLDEASVLAQTGRLYHAGAGLKYRLVSRSRGLLKGLGIRGEGRWLMRDGGVDFSDDERRGYGTATVGGFLAF